MFHDFPTLEPVRHIVGYNDEVIDLKMLDDDHVVVATNSEQVNVLVMALHIVYIVYNHSFFKRVHDL